MSLVIAPIVEGHTEQHCVERLLHRVWNEIVIGTTRLQVTSPIRGRRDRLTNAAVDEFASKLEEAKDELDARLSRDPGGCGQILLLLDAEDDCPKMLSASFRSEAAKLRGDTDFACVLAKRMLENWIVGGASALAGCHGFPDPLSPRSHCESGSGVKWLLEERKRAMPPGKRRAAPYKKIADGVALVRAIDLAEARSNCPSFAKLCRDLERRAHPPPAGA